MSEQQFQKEVMDELKIHDSQPTISIDDAIDKYLDEYVDYLFETEPKAHNEEWLLDNISDGESFHDWFVEKYDFFVMY